MLIVGEEVYGKCETKRTHAQVPGLYVACPFQPGGADMTKWCRACLLAKVETLRSELRRIGDAAHGAAKVGE